MSERPFISHFSPQRTDPELLERIHVQEERRHLLDESVAAMRESVLTKNKHHPLFIGPRGAGKTHLVRLIHHRLSQQADLAKKMRFAWLNEDETATSFLKLLILIYRDLSQRYPQNFPAADLQSIYGQSAEIARERLGESLLRHLGGCTLIVLMENLDSLFKHMPEGEQRIWRAFVQNHPVFATVGTAQSLFDGAADRSKPFFGFFDTRYLNPLNVDDAVRLLAKIALVNGDSDLADFLQTPIGHARVQAIHDLAGGNPRIYLIFSEFLTKESLDDLVRPFEETADRQLTSYYQERLRWLSPQQQEIVQFLCHQRQPVAVKVIAEGVFTSHNSITGQLKLLRDWRYLSSKQRGREVFYELAEPLMRLALQVKDTHDRKPLSLIVDFLRVWYSRKELLERMDKLTSGSVVKLYFEEAVNLIDAGGPNLRHEIFRRLIGVVDPEDCDDVKIATLRALAEETDDFQDWGRLAAVALGKGWNREALEPLNKAIERARLTDPATASLLNARGVLFTHLGDYKLALSDLDTGIDTPNLDKNLFCELVCNRGAVQSRLKQFDLAIKDFNIVVELDAGSDVCLRARHGRATSLQELNLLDDALLDLNFVIEDECADVDLVTKSLCSRAQIRLNKDELKLAVDDLSHVISHPKVPIRTKLAALGVRSVSSFDAENCVKDIAEFFSLQKDVSIKFGSKLTNLFAKHALRTIFVRSTYSDDYFGLVEVLLTTFKDAHLLSVLGDKLVRQLSDFASHAVAADLCRKWEGAWSGLVAKLSDEDRVQMEIPLRLLRTGLAYLESRMEGELLALPAEERKIVREALGLGTESTE